jgi:hypothetical protein
MFEAQEGNTMTIKIEIVKPVKKVMPRYKFFIYDGETLVMESKFAYKSQFNAYTRGMVAVQKLQAQSAAASD